MPNNRHAILLTTTLPFFPVTGRNILSPSLLTSGKVEAAQLSRLEYPKFGLG